MTGHAVMGTADSGAYLHGNRISAAFARFAPLAPHPSCRGAALGGRPHVIQARALARSGIQERMVNHSGPPIPGKGAMNRRSRIMIVNGDADEISLLRNAFAQVGWDIDVLEARSGKLAIDALRQNHLELAPIDLVMLSSHIQGQTCIDTLRIIRTYPGFGHQPIIVWSTFPPADDIINRCYLLGVMKFLEVPAEASGLALMAMEIKSHFSADGSLTPRGNWINSSRLAAVNQPADHR
jgi:CheY-like chemotaxis protein